MKQRSTIRISFHDVGEDTARELENMMRDTTELDCRIGGVAFKARIDHSEYIKKFVPESGVGFEFLMLAGSFKVNSSPLEQPPLPAIETMCAAMGWIVQKSSDRASTAAIDPGLYVWAEAVLGHANITGLIAALDSGLAPFKLRVTHANPKVAFDRPGGLVRENLELRFGW